MTRTSRGIGQRARDMIDFGRVLIVESGVVLGMPRAFPVLNVKRVTMKNPGLSVRLQYGTIHYAVRIEFLINYLEKSNHAVH